MPLLDQNENPLPTTVNGADIKKQVMDVRAVPTGTLIYNLIRFTAEEIGLDNMKNQLEHIKLQQKMVADPPQLAAIVAHLADVQQHRFILAKDLNDRFEGMDAEYRKKLGLEVVMGLPSPPPAIVEPKSD